jgi:hypothetical protein
VRRVLRYWQWSCVAVLAVVLAVSCGTSSRQRVRPPSPHKSSGRPISDPPPSRVTIHATIFREALVKKLASSLPRTGAGETEVMGQQIRYTWQREPVTVKFDRGRIFVTVNVLGRVQLMGDREFPISVTIAGEPVITADFKALMQSVEVMVKANGPVDRVNNAIEEKLHGLITATLEDFRLDVRPLLMSTFARLARPIEFNVGDQVACAELRITALEAGPTVLADGVEKELGVVVLPSVTLPCTPVEGGAGAPAGADGGVPGGTPGTDGGSPPTPGAPPDGGVPDAGSPELPPGFTLPLLANVASIPSGPFTVTVPIAARYEELSRALETAMKGKLFISDSHPELYLEKPEVYPSDDTVVIRMMLGGNASVGGAKLPMDGEIFFAGHPRVIDNQITVPDLEITPGTAAELVKLKFALDGAAIRDQARAALRVDLSERLAAVKDKLSTELSFSDNEGCVRARVLRSEVTGIFAHETYLRIYVLVDAQASLYMPCKR